MKKLIFATNNSHKRDEVHAMLNGLFQVATLREAGIDADIPEDADTLEGNAALKARYVHGITGDNVFADDTGLEVTALNGAPGVYSARYAGSSRDPQANTNKLLSALEKASDRRARFRTSVCLILDGREHFFDGTATGHITDAPRGEGGFGYDPVFCPDLPDDLQQKYEGRSPTFAELTAEEKNRISHRGKAIAALTSFLLQRPQ